MCRVRGALGLVPSYSKGGLIIFFYTWSTYIFIGSAGLGCSTLRVSTKLVLQSQCRLDELLFAHLRQVGLRESHVTAALAVQVAALQPWEQRPCLPPDVTLQPTVIGAADWPSN